MIDFLLLMVIPVLICIGYLSYRHYDAGNDWTDLVPAIVLQLGVAAVVVAIGLGIAYWQGTSDVEIWNGQVTNKQRNEVSCRHSYSCNCREVTSGSGKNQTTSIVCDTCYEHSYDVAWDVISSTSESVSIDTVDRQGLQMPQRWADAFIGQPFSSGHSFTNYIKANPKSVLLGQKGDLKKWGSWIPVYPEIYDYYLVHHLLNVGVIRVNDKVWDYLLSNANRTLGPSKQVNLIVVLVPTDDPSYAYAFRDKWLGGKKNDAITLIGSKDGHLIDWVDVVSWTPNKEYNIYVRDRILDEKFLDHQDRIVSIIAEETQNRFQRLHMKTMEWLVRGFQPSGQAMLIILLVGIAGSITTCIMSSRLIEES